MSYTLCKANVVKIVDSERTKDKLMKDGFTLVEESEIINDVPAGVENPKSETTDKKKSSKNKGKGKKNTKGKTEDAKPEEVQEGGEGNAEGTTGSDVDSGGSSTGS